MTIEVSSVKPAQTNVFRDFSKTATNNVGHVASNKNHTAISIAAAAGVAALAIGGIIYYARRGKVKANDIKENASGVANNIKKFFSKDNQLVEGVTLDKGKALLSDGSGFSGILKTTNAKGENISITYADGIMRESSINDKLYKTYRPLTDKGNVIGTDIVTHLKDGAKQYTRLEFHDNGKVKYITKLTADDSYFGKLTGYSKSGKKFVEAQCNSCNSDYAKYFDENGQMVRHIYSTDKEFVQANGFAEDVFENGVLIKRCTGSPCGNFMTKIIADEPIVRNSVRYFNNGVPSTKIYSKCGRMPVMSDNNKNALLHQFKFDYEPSIQTFSIQGNFNKEPFYIAINRETGKITDACYTVTDKPLSKESLKEIFSEADTVINVAQKENLDVTLADEFINIPDLVAKLKAQLLN